MSEVRTSPWPDDLWDFGFFPEREDRLHELAELAEQEDWTYKYTETEHQYPILFNYLRYTYRRLAEENKLRPFHSTIEARSRCHFRSA